MLSNVLRISSRVAKVIVILLVFLLSACSSTKKLEPETLWLKKQRVYINGVQTKDPLLINQLIQEPNQRVLGLPIKLWLYNSSGRKSNFFNKWLRRIGEPPVIYTDEIAGVSINRLKNFYKRKGYLNVAVDNNIAVNNKATKAKQTILIETNEPFTIDEIELQSPDSRFDSVLTNNQMALPLKKGMNLNLSIVDNDRQELTSLLRNQGIYDFQKSLLSYEIRGDTTARSESKKLRVRRIIDSTAIFRPFRIGRTKVFSEGATENDFTLSIVNGIEFFGIDELSFDPDVVARRISFKPGTTYNQSLLSTTVDLIGDLNHFLYPNIELVPEDDQTLTASIYLRNRKRYALNADLDLTHSNIQQLGTTLRSSILARNVFGSHENLSLALSGSIGNSLLPGDNLTTELGIDINLSVPRLWMIFPTSNLISEQKHPQTTLQVGTNFQKNLGLDRQTFNAIYRFNYRTDKRRYSFEFPSITYVNHLNPDNFFSIYRNTFDRLNLLADPIRGDSNYASFFNTNQGITEADLLIPEGANAFINATLSGTIPLSKEDALEVRRINERRNRLTENNFIVSSSFNYSFQNSENRNSPNYSQFGLKFELAGALLDFIDSSSKESIFKVPFAQYIKAEINTIKHFELSDDTRFATRFFAGMALPFGSGNNVPFVRSYFAGGSNDIRSWNAYTLGPGTTNQINEFNDANFKITWSNELRFDLSQSIKGALFTDVGNIWNVLDDTEVEEAVFKGWSSLKDLAIGAGVGLRYDFDYFLFRIDLGWKIYNPAFTGDNRWFYNQTNNRPIFNVGINHPF
jgi:outer membrane protein assembly factor BamA